jgi:hypothetical protein
VIIAFGGAAGSGKDTCGDRLLERWEFKKESFARSLKEMAKIAFPCLTGAQLYGSTAHRNEELLEYPLDGCPFCGETNLVVPTGKQDRKCARCWKHFGHYLTPRIILQTLGTEWGRRLSPNVWVDSLFGRIAYDLENKHHVITDCRFEHKAISDRGGITILLTRGMVLVNPEVNPLRQFVYQDEDRPLRDFWELPGGLTGYHESETAIFDTKLSDWTYIIDNANQSLDVTLAEIDEIMERILERNPVPIPL